MLHIAVARPHLYVCCCPCCLATCSCSNSCCGLLQCAIWPLVTRSLGTSLGCYTTLVLLLVLLLLLWQQCNRLLPYLLQRWGQWQPLLQLLLGCVWLIEAGLTSCSRRGRLLVLLLVMHGSLAAVWLLRCPCRLLPCLLLAALALLLLSLLPFALPGVPVLLCAAQACCDCAAGMHQQQGLVCRLHRVPVVPSRNESSEQDLVPWLQQLPLQIAVSSGRKTRAQRRHSKAQMSPLRNVQVVGAQLNTSLHVDHWLRQPLTRELLPLLYRQKPAPHTNLFASDPVRVTGVDCTAPVSCLTLRR